MLINGYMLKEAIQCWELRRQTADNAFDDSLVAFPGEEKMNPKAISEELERCEQAIVDLQVLQTRYNLEARVTVQDRNMTLLSAVKRVGGAGRREKMWRQAVGQKRDRWDRPETSRSKDSEYAQRTITQEAASEMAQGTARFAGALRAAIGRGNAQNIDFDCDASLFE